MLTIWTTWIITPITIAIIIPNYNYGLCYKLYIIVKKFNYWPDIEIYVNYINYFYQYTA